MKIPVEFCFPDEWTDKEKQEAQDAIERKIAEKLRPLADQIIKDNKKDSKE